MLTLLSEDKRAAMVGGGDALEKLARAAGQWRVWLRLWLRRCRH
ncbi:hypothetical protein [Streptomyces lydicus]